MKSFAIRLKSTILASAFALSSGMAFAQTLYSDGHADFGVVFEDSSWIIHYHFDSGAVLDGATITEDLEFEPGEVIVLLGDSAKVSLPVPVAFLGANTGDDIWLIPQIQMQGVPWLGFNTEELDNTWGPIKFALSSFSGPGNFALWSTGSFGEPTIKMQTNDGVDPDVDFETIGITHAHYNWGFTELGTYELGITISALNQDPSIGFQTGTATIIVQVVPEPTSVLLILTAGAVLGFARRRRSDR